MDEKVERLPGDGDAHHDPEHHHGAEGNRDAGVFHVPVDRAVEKVVARVGGQAGDGADGFHDRRGIDAGLGLDEDEAEPLALRRRVFQRAVVGGEDVRLAEKTLVRLAQPDHARLLVVDLKGAADLQLDALFLKLLHADLIDDDRVWQAQILDPTREHFSRTPDERGGVESGELHRLERAVGQARIEQAPEKRDRPFDAGHALHAIHFDVAHGHDFVDLLDLGVGDPDRHLDIAQRGRGPAHQPAENRDLLRHEQRAKREAAHEHRVFRPVPVKHLERKA